MSYDNWKTTNPDDNELGPEPDDSLPEMYWRAPTGVVFAVVDWDAEFVTVQHDEGWTWKVPADEFSARWQPFNEEIEQ